MPSPARLYHRTCPFLPHLVYGFARADCAFVLRFTALARSFTATFSFTAFVPCLPFIFALRLLRFTFSDRHLLLPVLLRFRWSSGVVTLPFLHVISFGHSTFSHVVDTTYTPLRTFVPFTLFPRFALLICLLFVTVQYVFIVVDSTRCCCSTTFVRVFTPIPVRLI